MKTLPYLIVVLAFAVPLAEEARAQSPKPLAEEAQAKVAREGSAVAKRVFSSQDPNAAFARLSPREQERFRAAMTPGDYLPVQEKADHPSVAAAKKYRGCWAVHATGGRKALAGNTLYTYWQTTEVCVRNGRVYKVEVYDVGGETSTPGWSRGKPVTYRKNVGWEGRGISENHFVLSAGPWDIQKPIDCLQLRLNADGYHRRLTKSCDPASR